MASDREAERVMTARRPAGLVRQGRLVASPLPAVASFA
ncbi:hypothetical protein FHR81_001780 [Actinoalloteichus hoggarensis]|nr:hypothetical protein [Actinoalloteichus hoggarensis]